MLQKFKSLSLIQKAGLVQILLAIVISITNTVVVLMTFGSFSGYAAEADSTLLFVCMSLYGASVFRIAAGLYGFYVKEQGMLVFVAIILIIISMPSELKLNLASILQLIGVLAAVVYFNGAVRKEPIKLDLSFLDFRHRR